MNGRDGVRQELLRRLADPGFAIVGEAIGFHGVTEGFPDGPGMIRTPLSESSTIAVAAGLAMAGRRVVVELVDPSGLARATDVLAELTGLRVVIRAPLAQQGVGAGHAPRGITCAVAATPDDLVGMLVHALDGDGPVVILEAPSASDSTGAASPVPPLGKAVVRRAGRACTVLAVGWEVRQALAVAESRDAEVVDLRGFSPLDVETIGASVRKTGRAIAAGAPEALLVALREAFLHLESPLAEAGDLARALDEAIHY